MLASAWPNDRIADVVGAALVAGVVLCTGCSWDDLDLPSDNGNGPNVASVAVTPAALGLGGVGDSALMLAEAYDRLGRPLEGRTFQWLVSDSAIASVDSAGTLRALALGNVTVGATTDGVYGSAEVEIDAAFAVERACGQCHSNLGGDHVDLGFSSVSCWLCHNPAGETHRQFQNNHMMVGACFELIGIHTAIQCSGCHVKEGSGLRFTPSDENDCLACHQSEYDAAHGGSSFPTTCASCHTPNRWVGATIDHTAASGGFDLVAVHAALSCTSCHVAGSYAPLFSPIDENDCIACHQSDYDSQHVGSGDPTSCLSCHDGTVWDGATFDHGIASGGFDLQGPHTSLSCTGCHASATGQPLFSPVDESDCIACHQSDYDSQHAGSGYPTSCLTCHGGVVWTGANFNHDADYFPIFSGRHAGEWQSCTTCHSQQGDFTVFTCFNCHRHNQADMDDTHRGLSGYSYDSATCLGCHPAGAAP